MADNKKYYYMRLKENFFETEEMIMLESMTDGFLYSNILIKLYLKSLKYEGRLLFKDTIPYNAQMISTITRHPLEIVEKALEVFKDLELITVLEGNVLYMSEIELLVGKTSTEADRKRAVRKQIESGEMTGLIKQRTNVRQMSDKSIPEYRDKSIEYRDKSLEEKEVQTGEELKTPPPSSTLFNMNFVKIKQYFEQSVINQQSNYQQNKQLNKLLEDYQDPQFIIKAMDVAVEREVPKLNYIKGILKGWGTEGITNYQQLIKVGGSTNGKPRHTDTNYHGKTPEEIELLERMRNYTSPS